MTSTEYDPRQQEMPQSEKLFGLPGVDGIWLFIAGDILVFSLMFLVYSYYRSLAPELFHESHLELKRAFGLANTILLLTSSWFVVMAVSCARRQLIAPCRVMFVTAFCCGVGFVISKVFEYSDKISHGFTMQTNDFFMFYYALTGIHCVHVIVGLGGLGFIISQLGKARFEQRDIRLFESGATFWHMVDLLWIVLFPLLYLLP